MTRLDVIATELSDPAAAGRIAPASLLHVITEAQLAIIQGRDAHASFQDLLHNLLRATDCPFGFISEVLHDSDGAPYMRTVALSNLAWDSEHNAWLERDDLSGLAFQDLDPVVGTVLRTHAPVIVNEVAIEPRSEGAPTGWPVIEKFLGLPVFSEGALVGCIGLANRPDAFDARTAADLQPIVTTCGVMILIERTRRSQQSAERRERDFVSILSHELRTPMTLIRGSLGLISRLPEDSVSPKARDLLEYANEGTRRIVRVLDDLVAVASIDGGRLQLKRGACRLADVVDAAVCDQGQAAEKAGVSLESEPMPSVVLELDEDRIAQIISQLLSNAITVSEPGATVRIGSTVTAETVSIHIDDDGPGISPADQHQIFQRFRQLEAPETRRYEGSGIGLYIARELAQRHGGEISVESKLGEGSRFTLGLPRTGGPENCS